MSISVNNSTITLNFARTASILGMKRSITFNAANVVDFSASHKSPNVNGCRLFGIYIPFFLRIGSFYSFSNRSWEYWDVNHLRRGRYCEFQLRGHEYARVVAKISNLDAINQLNSMGISR